jgi:anhydro-N-acetylmuramic acid kinase
MKKYLGIGLMSGTSCDGLDIALVEFTFDKEWKYQILHTQSNHYDSEWRDKLLHCHLWESVELIAFHSEFGKFMGEKINQFLKELNIESGKIDFIASHGHTVFHNPEKSYSFQIGSGAHLAASTGIKSICDFRITDVAYGGQGAPLVPYADEHLFPDYDACLNLGGFANISFRENEQRIAFDICPVNIVLNRLCRELGKEYDENGNIAKSGNFIQKLFDELNELSYYHQKHPKSLGREFADAVVLLIIDKYRMNFKLEDIIATFTKHAAYQIAKTLNVTSNKAMFTGGGTYNIYLIACIKEYHQGAIVIPDDTLVNFKEALAFAYLGLMRCEATENTLHTVTGAKKNTCSGAVYLP